MPPESSDGDLERQHYGVPGVKPGRRKLPDLDSSMVPREMKGRHLKLEVLWEENIAWHLDEHCYSRFCDPIRPGERRLQLMMQQNHGGGENLFIDYAGNAVPK